MRAPFSEAAATGDMRRLRGYERKEVSSHGIKASKKAAVTHRVSNSGLLSPTPWNCSDQLHPLREKTRGSEIRSREERETDVCGAVAPLLFAAHREKRKNWGKEKRHVEEEQNVI